ncbi:MAG: Glyoxalase/bleomycin resistance protein/dioxygenase [Verrucomicrobia bacterium]|nr:Glyoxalase/bleomycin resistance protein/dioxygenase [Verrucomicrobiota bacterium]
MSSFILRDVTLVTRSIAKVLPFYRDTLGLVARERDGKTLELGFSDAAPPVITFVENASAIAPANRVAGLFHLALLVPDRPALAGVLAQLVERRQPLEGLSDHGVSEAIYLSDPDGNGLEVYRDRPREEWPMNGERVAMVTRALDPRGLLRELAGPRPPSPLARAAFGHLHLQVTSLAPARKFYLEEMGLAVRQDDYPGAVFMAADGYHHHIAINTWGNPAKRPAGELTGLRSFSAGMKAISAASELADPDGIQVTLAPL